MADKSDNVDTAEGTKGAGGGIVSLLKKYGLNLILFTSVWGLGYFRFSALWLLMVFAIGFWKEKASSRKNQTVDLARKVMKNERQSIVHVVGDLPSWVYFPDIERAEWLNKIVKQMWPYVEGYVVDMLHNTVEPAVRDNLPKALKNFRFENISLGRYPPRIGGVKVYTDNISRDEIIMDLEIFYAGDCEIDLSVKAIKRVKAGIKDVQLHGTMRVEMRPLVRKIPLVGGLSIYFLKRPALDFNLTNLANVFDVPGLSDLLHAVIEDQLAVFLVLPNRIVVPLMDTTSISSLKNPMPSGVLHIGVLEARDLVRRDIGVLKKGKSDPYGIVTVGQQTFTTKVINNSIAPIWNQHFEAIVFEVFGQSVDIDLFDEDKSDKDDPLGSLSLDIFHLSKLGQLDSWLPLEDIEHGDLHLHLSWLKLSDKRADLMQESSVDEAHKESEFSPAVLVVTLDSGKELPIGRKASVMPSPYCKLTVGQKSWKSQVQHTTNVPVWEEMCTFFVQKPQIQELTVQVFDGKKNAAIGDLTVPIKNLIDQPGMDMERPFKLNNSGPHSQLILKLCLRALKSTSSVVATEADLKELLLSEQPEETAAGAEIAPDETAAAAADDQPVKESKESDNVTTPSVEETPAPMNDIKTSGTPPAVAPETALPEPAVTENKSEPNGKIQLTLKYDEKKNQLSVTVHKAVGLPLEDADHPPDPYVRIYLLPDKSKSGKGKTEVMKEARDATYDETFDFACKKAEFSERTLDIAVKNDSSFLALANPLLGTLLLNLGNLDLSEPVTEWFVLKGDDSDGISRSSSKSSS